MAGLQAPVVEATVLLLVPGVEGGWQHRETSGNVGAGRLQLARVPQAAPLQPRDVLDELWEQGRGVLRGRPAATGLPEVRTGLGLAGPGPTSPPPDPCLLGSPEGSGTGHHETCAAAPSQ